MKVVARLNKVRNKKVTSALYLLCKNVEDDDNNYYDRIRFVNITMMMMMISVGYHERTLQHCVVHVSLPARNNTWRI